MRGLLRMLAGALVLCVVAGATTIGDLRSAPPDANVDFVNFECVPVHPLAVTPDGRLLLVAHTAAAELVVYQLGIGLPRRLARIPVGLGPVSVAARDSREAWVACEVSGDLNLVDLRTFQVTRVVATGGTPVDVAFAGTPKRAFVTLEREDAVQVFDANEPMNRTLTVRLPARRPRALAVSRDGKEIFIAALLSGNHTAVVPAGLLASSERPPVGEMHGGLTAPRTATIVRRDDRGHWRDQAGSSWDRTVPYRSQSVGLVTLGVESGAVRQTSDLHMASAFNLAVHPTRQEVAIVGQQARNMVQFQSNLRGKFVESRLAVLRGSSRLTTRGLGESEPRWGGASASSNVEAPVGLPSALAWSRDGASLFVTSLTSDELLVLDADGVVRSRVATSPEPVAVLPHPVAHQLFVLGRGRSELQVFDLASLQPIASLSLGFDPTPRDYAAGRAVFYGGRHSLGGDLACASCHLNGGKDGLAWDLGDPRGAYLAPPPDSRNTRLSGFHPLKGPMATPILRGLDPASRLHWRGELSNLAAFRATFDSLLGNRSEITDSEMNDLADFVFSLSPLPNRVRELDGSLPAEAYGHSSARRGESAFRRIGSMNGWECARCHVTRRQAERRVFDARFLGAEQDLRIASLLDVSQTTNGPDLRPGTVLLCAGFSHDGSFRALRGFLRHHAPDLAADAAADSILADIEAYLHSIDVCGTPAIGAEVVFPASAGSWANPKPRLDSLLASAVRRQCDVVAHLMVDGQVRGFLAVGADAWQVDSNTEPVRSTLQLLELVGDGRVLRVMGVPPGCGRRMALDRDRDGSWDQDERRNGTDPDDGSGIPTAPKGE